MTYLQLVQAYMNELGLSGAPTVQSIAAGVPTLASGVTPPLEIVNVCRWIHDANLDIDNQWMDWKYHWVQYGPTTAQPMVINTQAPQIQYLPAAQLPVQQWDINKFRYRTTAVGGLTWQPLYYVERQEMIDRYDPDNASPGPPEVFTVNPDLSVSFGAPFDQAYDFLAEFWQRPVELQASADTPMMPSQFHRAVLCRAAVMYGNREDAPEIISGLTAEYLQWMDKLQSDQLEGFEIRRSSTDRLRHEPRHTEIYRFIQ